MTICFTHLSPLSHFILLRPLCCRPKILDPLRSLRPWRHLWTTPYNEHCKTTKYVCCNRDRYNRVWLKLFMVGSFSSKHVACVKNQHHLNGHTCDALLSIWIEFHIFYISMKMIKEWTNQGTENIICIAMICFTISKQIIWRAVNSKQMYFFSSSNGPVYFEG